MASQTAAASDAPAGSTLAAGAAGALSQWGEKKRAWAIRNDVLTSMLEEVDTFRCRSGMADEIQEEDEPVRGGHAVADTLQQMVVLHSSVLGFDKTVKLFSYASLLASQMLPRLRINEDSALVAGLEAIGGHLSLYRVTTRWCGGCFGLPAESLNLFTDCWDGGWHNPLIRRCVRWQSWAMTAYYPMEHLAWLATLAPKLFKRLDVDRLWRMSCYFWVLWLLLDIVATCLRLRELDALERHLARHGLLTSRSKATLERSRTSLCRHSTRILLYLPNAVHWTLVPNSPCCLPPWLVNGLGLAEALVGSYAYAKGDSTSRPVL